MQSNQTASLIFRIFTVKYRMTFQERATTLVWVNWVLASFSFHGGRRRCCCCCCCCRLRRLRYCRTSAMDVPAPWMMIFIIGYHSIHHRSIISSQQCNVMPCSMFRLQSQSQSSIPIVLHPRAHIRLRVRAFVRACGCLIDNRRVFEDRMALMGDNIISSLTKFVYNMSGRHFC